MLSPKTNRVSGRARSMARVMCAGRMSDPGLAVMIAAPGNGGRCPGVGGGERVPGYSSRSTCVGDLDAASPGSRGGEPRRPPIDEELSDRGGAAGAGEDTA